jgi:uncharacterized membrane protein
MTDGIKTMSALALCGAFAAALTMAATPGKAKADDFEKCYGIAKAGENDCASEGNNSCAGTAKSDYEGRAWKEVKTGTCTTIEIEMKKADGSAGKRKGSLSPIMG